MAAVSLFCNTNMAAMTSCGNARKTVASCSRSVSQGEAQKTARFMLFFLAPFYALNLN